MLTFIKKIVGEKNISETQLDLFSHSFDSSIKKSKKQTPLAIIYPTSKEQLHKILTFINRKTISMNIQGFGTNPMGSTLTKDYALDITRFNKIIHFNENKNILTVEPGANIENINQFLSQFELEIPCNKLIESTSTISGLIYTNHHTPNHYEYELLKTIEEIECLDGTGKTYYFKKEKLPKLPFLNHFIITQIKIRVQKIEKTRSIQKTIIENISDLQEKLKKTTKGTFKKYILTKTSSKLFGQNEGYYIIEHLNNDYGNTLERDHIEILNNYEQKIFRKTNTKELYFFDFIKIDIKDAYDILQDLDEREIPAIGYIVEDKIVLNFFLKTNLELSLFNKKHQVANSDGSVGTGYSYENIYLLSQDTIREYKKQKDLHDYNNVLSKKLI